MLRRLCWISLLSFALAACSVNGQAVRKDSCTAEDLARATTPATLRDLTDRCDKILASTFSKLNALKPIPRKAISLSQRPDPIGSTDRASIETYLYFYVFEAYPSDDALSRLDNVLDWMNKAFAIIEVKLVGCEERREVNHAMAQKRIEVVRRYLLDAGLDPRVPIRTEIVAASQPDTNSGRAKDRVVTIEVVAHRAHGIK